MRAIKLHEFGPADNLQLEELPDLEPAAGELRVRVEAAGVHLLDTTLRTGAAGPMPVPELPTIPGREVAGTVDRIGQGVSETWQGARVVAHLGMVPGGYAEQAVTAVTNPNLFRVPGAVTAAEAVAMVGTGRTARGILELAPLGPDDVVLVPSATGGLGWLLVQAAARAGATVVALAGGPEKVAKLHDLGPDLAVDYLEPGWDRTVRDRVGDVSVVLDGVGGDVGRTACGLLRPGGRFVTFGWSSGKPADVTELAKTGGVSVVEVLGPPLAALPGGIPGLAARALDELASGPWRPLVTTYPLEEAARAHADLEQRRSVGKVVLVP